VRYRTLIPIAVLIAILAVLAFVRIDLEPFRPSLEEALSGAAGRESTLERMSLRLFPLPYVEVAGLSVAGPSEEAPPLARVARGEVWVHPWGWLTRGALELTIDLEAPEVNLSPDDPLVPLPVPGPVPDVEPPSAEAESESAGREGEEAPPEVVLRGIEITDGRVTWGDLVAEGVQASGSLETAGAGALTIDADLPGLGRLREVRIRLEPAENGPLVDASGRLLEGNLAGIDRALALGQGLEGGIEGEISARLAGADLRRLELEAELRDGRAAGPGARVDGRIRVDAEAGGNLRVDLTRLDLALPGVAHKPAGTPLLVEGTLDDPIDWTRLEGLLLQVAEARIPVGLRLDGSPVVRLGPGAVPLAPLTSLLERAPPGLEGTVSLEGPVTVAVEPLHVLGRVVLDSVRVPVASGVATVSGPLDAVGNRLRSAGLQVELAEQQFVVAPTVEIPSADFTVELRTEGSDLEAVGRALTGRNELAGLLSTNMRLSGGLPTDDAELLTMLHGTSRLDIRDGQIRGFSLAREALGALAELPIMVAELRGKDLSRYEEQDFEELSGDFQLGKGLLRTENLVLRYRHSTAKLRGTVGLVDGALDLTGTLTLSRDLDEELAGTGSGKQRVIPIAGVGGTVTRPRVELDRDAVAAAARAYLGQDRVLEKLEEKVGKEGAEAIEGILDQILRPREKNP
jgi:hypothetical protein